MKKQSFWVLSTHASAEVCRTENLSVRQTLSAGGWSGVWMGRWKEIWMGRKNQSLRNPGHTVLKKRGRRVGVRWSIFPKSLKTPSPRNPWKTNLSEFPVTLLWKKRGGGLVWVRESAFSDLDLARFLQFCYRLEEFLAQKQLIFHWDWFFRYIVLVDLGISNIGWAKKRLVF